MNAPVELPSGKILNLARFIALIESEKTTDGDYDLILEGYATPITLEKKDVEVLKRRLQSDSNLGQAESKHSPTPSHESGWDRDEQLQKNQAALELLKKRRERHQNLSEDESKRREELFADFKNIVDSERLPGQKLYSQT